MAFSLVLRMTLQNRLPYGVFPSPRRSWMFRRKQDPIPLAIHRAARSCTATAHRWLSLDSCPSLRTLWSAIVKTPNFSAQGRTSPVRLLQRAFVFLVLKQTSQSRSFGEWVNASSVSLPLSQDIPDLILENCVRMHAILFLSDFLWNPLTSQEDLPKDLSKPSCHSSFYLVFWISGNGTSVVASSSLRSDTELEDELEAPGCSFRLFFSTSPV